MYLAAHSAIDSGQNLGRSTARRLAAQPQRSVGVVDPRAVRTPAHAPNGRGVRHGARCAPLHRGDSNPSRILGGHEGHFAAVGRDCRQACSMRFSDQRGIRLVPASRPQLTAAIIALTPVYHQQTVAQNVEQSAGGMESPVFGNPHGDTHQGGGRRRPKPRPNHDRHHNHRQECQAFSNVLARHRCPPAWKLHAGRNQWVIAQMRILMPRPYAAGEKL